MSSSKPTSPELITCREPNAQGALLVYQDHILLITFGEAPAHYMPLYVNIWFTIMSA